MLRREGVLDIERGAIRPSFGMFALEATDNRLLLSLLLS